MAKYVPKKISPSLQRRREQVAIELVDMQMLQALGFQEQVESDHVPNVYKVLYEKALTGNTKAIQIYLDRVIGKEIEKVESKHTDVASIMALWMQAAESAPKPEVVDVIIVEEEENS